MLQLPPEFLHILLSGLSFLHSLAVFGPSAGSEMPFDLFEQEEGRRESADTLHREEPWRTETPQFLDPVLLGHTRNS